MLVYWFVVDVHAQHVCVFLGYQHWVCYPCGFLCFSDELGVEQPVDFLSDCFALWFENRLRACFTGFMFGLMCKACSANSRGMPGISAGHQANIFHSSRRNVIKAVACSSGK